MGVLWVILVTCAGITALYFATDEAWKALERLDSRREMWRQVRHLMRNEETR